MRGGHWALEAEGGKAYDPKVIRKLLSFVIPYKWYFVGALSFMIVNIPLNLIGPYLMKIAIDDGIAKRNMLVLALSSGAYLLSMLLGLLSSFGQGYLLAKGGQSVLFEIRGRLFSHIQRLSLGFFSKQETGQLISRLVNDVGALHDFLNFAVISIINDLLTLIGIIAIMLYMNLELSLISFAFLPLLIGLVLSFRSKMRRAYREVRRKIGKVTAGIQEGVAGVRVTQSFAKERENLERFNRTNLENLQANMQAAVVWSSFFPLVDIVGALATAAIIWYGGIQVVHGKMTLGVIVAFLGYVQRFFWPIMDLTRIYNMMQSATAASERIFEVMDTKPEIEDAEDAIELTDVKGNIRLKDVWFRYNEEDGFVIKGISNEIREGEVVALVGPTGCGKTTLVNLISRMYEPQMGAIYLDGVDIRRIKQSSLRRQMVVVPQDPFIFSGTIRENIRYGKLEAKDEEVEEAARIVRAHEFIAELPNGYDTEVGERGARLSGGQKQLISFARALLANPRILILDEATSNIDIYTEMLIQEALAELFRGRTVIVIAHRLSTVRSADRILVMEDGRIVEEGSHKELLEMGGVYKRLYEAQFATLSP
jgi:ABC-type multidrug transport system fused ATPase/permease subunit